MTQTHVQQLKPRFQVKKVEGTFIKKVAYYEVIENEEGVKIGKRLTYKDKECDRGWMVYFPNGASIHIATEAELKRMGYDKSASLVDMESGDEVAAEAEFDLERDVKLKTRTRHANASQTRKGA
jgi:hypothetical protein